MERLGYFINKKIGNFPVLLIVIILFALLIRVVNVSQNPPSLAWDEAAFGYNAFSLGIDGRDEFGILLPYKYIESFGDFKPVLYAYLSVIPVKIFGLNEFSIRLPSILLGVLTVIMTYFLVLRIFFKSKNKYYYALSAAFFLAISPWHINLSRAAFEANVATFLIVVGVWAFLAAIQDKKWYLIISAIFFSLSFYTFNTPRIVVPILVAILALGTWRELLKIKKQIVLSMIIGLILILPIIPFLASPQASLRFKEVNIFSDISVIERTNQEIANDGGSIFSKVIHNRRFAFTIEFMSHYLDTFNPDFLFIHGDENKRFSTQDVGQMYLWDLPFLLVGIGILFLKRESYWWVIPVWFFVGIIPAATARETPHALRLETTLPMLQIVTAIGFVSVLSWLRRYKRKSIFYAAFGLFSFLLVINSLYYLHGYFKHYPREYSSYWQYGYKEAVNYASSQEQNYDHIYVTDLLGRPYIYFLFYQKTDPRVFRTTAQVERDIFGFVKVKGFGKYKFGDERRLAQGETGKKLFIGNPKNFPEGAKKLRTFSTIDGYPELVAYTY
jgi:4-amino-4-deoxy-L-arabinose transferase-like glycosyltransferase